MNCRFTYSIKFVSDMDAAVQFYRDVMGLPLKFQSPEWSEFATGATTLALHKASDKNPVGKVQLGFSVPDLDRFYQEMSEKGFKFTQVPTIEGRSKLARFIDLDGVECSVSNDNN